MDVQEILDSVKRSFGDESGVQVTDTDIIRWINQGMRMFVMQNENLLVTEGFANAVANQQTYGLPADLLVLRGLRYRENGGTQYFKLQGYDLAKFNEQIDGWDGSTEGPGVPLLYTVIGSNFSVWPLPTEASASGFKITYHRTPVEVATTVDEPELPILYHELLINYCLQQAYELDEDWEAAGNKVSQVDRDANLLRGREDWKIQETYPVINVLYEDDW
jgi:hypothetical protein